MLKLIDYNIVGWNMLFHLNMMNFVYKYGTNWFSTKNSLAEVEEKTVVTVDDSGTLRLCQLTDYPIGVCVKIYDGNYFVQTVGEAIVKTSEGVDSSQINGYVYLSDVGVVSVTTDLSSLPEYYKVIGRCSEIIDENTIKVVLENVGNTSDVFCSNYTLNSTIMYENGNGNQIQTIKAAFEIDKDTGSIIPTLNYLYDGTENVGNITVSEAIVTITFLPIFEQAPVCRLSHYHTTPSTYSLDVYNDKAVITLYDLEGNPVNWLDSTENPKILFLGHGV